MSEATIRKSPKWIIYIIERETGLSVRKFASSKKLQESMLYDIINGRLQINFKQSSRNTNATKCVIALNDIGITLKNLLDIRMEFLKKEMVRTQNVAP